MDLYISRIKRLIGVAIFVTLAIGSGIMVVSSIQLTDTSHSASAG